MLLTYQDAVERLIDYLGAQFSDTVLRDCKKACVEALRDLIQTHTWTYLYQTGRIILTTSFTDGLITYQATGGGVPNQVNLTGGTWPAWAAVGILRIDNINYDVIRRIDGVTLQLAPGISPPRDIDAPVAFGLFQDSYTLPDDFAEMDQTFIPITWGQVCYTHPREWMYEISRWGLVGNPMIYTIMTDPDFGGRLCMKFAPFPFLEYPVEFLYKRHARPLITYRSSAGTISIQAASNQATGTGTAFDAGMVDNAVLRISGVPKKPPTARWGDNPAVFESKITAVDPIAQTLTTWDSVPAAYSNASYAISSYVDIETGAMEQAYERCTEWHVCMSRKQKDKKEAEAQYLEALEVAKCADSRNMLPRVAGPATSMRRRLKDYPIDLGREG